MGYGDQSAANAEPSYWQNTCPHPRNELRFKIGRDGAKRYYRQCLVCFDQIGSQVANATARGGEPEFDQAAREAMQVRRLDVWRSQDERRRREEHTAWLREHDAYLRTPAWKKKRALALQRDKGTCQGCLEAPAVHVHHLTYEHWQDELLFELVSLCERCHERAHTARAGR